MDDNEVRRIEEELERVAATDPKALSAKSRQTAALRALNALEARIRDLRIERMFGESAEHERTIAERLAELQHRRVRIEAWLQPESKAWFLGLGEASANPSAAVFSMGGRGQNVSRLVPIQVRITREQEMALEVTKVRTGRTVSQLLRDALAVDRIRQTRQWNRTESGGQLTVKRWVRCDQPTVRALRMIADREHLTVSAIVRALIQTVLGV